MPVPVPDLDDRTFDQLAAEARALIPKNFPEWTDHNPSDPGITLLELFAFLLEAAIYQINRVPERSLEHFAELVGVTRGEGEAIERMLGRALETLEPKYRAITEDEFEYLAKDEFERLTDQPEIIARAKAVIEVVDTPNVFPDEQFIKIIIVPNDPDTPEPRPDDDLRQDVFKFLRSRCLITTRIKVVAPDYTPVQIETTVVRDHASRLDRKAVQRAVREAITVFLSPITGGVDGKGWEFGRPVFRSELYQLIEDTPGVDHVKRLIMNGDETVGELQLSSPTSLANLDVGEDKLKVTVVDTQREK